jgi:hypothetical protein
MVRAYIGVNLLPKQARDVAVAVKESEGSVRPDGM